MNVLHLITELDLGGAERQLVSLAPQFDRARWRVSVACLHGAAPLRRDLESAGIPVIHLHSRHKADFTPLIRLRRLIRDQHIDILHTHLIQADLLGALAGAPILVTTKHSLDYFTRHPGWLKRLSALATRRCDKIIAVSNAVRSQYPDAEIIPNGIDVAGIAATPAAPSSANKTVIAVGKLSERKGQADLLAAWPAVHNRYPTAQLLLVGDGPDRATLETLDKTGTVHFLGQRDDVPSLLKSAELFVLPSRTEGLPLVVAEAMAAGTPIVATDVGGVRELTDKDAILVPPQTPAALADGILTLLGNPTHARTLSTAARQRVEQFDIRHTATRLGALYDSLLQAKTQT